MCNLPHIIYIIYHVQNIYLIYLTQPAHLIQHTASALHNTPRRSTMSFHRVLLNLNDGNKLSIDDETKLKRFDKKPEAKS